MAESLDARLQRTVERDIADDTAALNWIKGLPSDAIDDGTRQAVIASLEGGIATFETLAETMKRQGRWISQT